MNQRRIAKLKRVTDWAGNTLQFTTPGAGRTYRCPLLFIDKENVPEFDGDEAWFEIERIPAVPWPFWRAIRQLDEPEDHANASARP